MSLFLCLVTLQWNIPADSCVVVSLHALSSAIHAVMHNIAYKFLFRRAILLRHLNILPYDVQFEAYLTPDAVGDEAPPMLHAR